VSAPTAVAEPFASAGALDGLSPADPALTERFVAFVRREYWNHAEWDEHLAADAHDNAYIKARGQIDQLLRNGA